MNSNVAFCSATQDSCHWPLVAVAISVAISLAIAGCGSQPIELTAPVVVVDSLLWVRGGDQLRLLRFLDNKGVEHEGWLRRVEWPDDGDPDTPPPPMQLVVILGGIGTAQRAAEIAPVPPGVSLMALDYAYDRSRQPTHGNILKNVPEIRSAAYATPRGINAAIGYLLDLPDADPRGVLVTGLSFGSTFVLKALADLPREFDEEGRDLGPQGVRAVAVYYWGADLPRMARWRMSHRPWWERESVAWGLKLLFPDMEPNKTIGKISPRPLLLINAREDEFISEDAGHRLAAAAQEPFDQIWLPGMHMHPNADALMRELVTHTMAWLAEVEGAPAASAQP
jgi:dienelactone hydrolase